MDLTPTAWQLWLVAALVFGGLEMSLSGFVTLWFALGALVAALASALGLGINGQLLLFTATAGALFVTSRTLFKKAFMRKATLLRTGVEAMLGQEAVVIEAVLDPQGGTVRINGELWAARSLSGPVGEGERVTVEQIEGLKLWVRRSTARHEVLLHSEEGTG
ncbi:NfeD family protein [Stigmatella erecta]|uniref:Membrane protein implicated in regulation of membrane protease activity n=1 Tax=Stigmatella erecta TaxID=83460 RepID=A0A1H9ZK46_9BACT|nr:NfeD family protein [Stigmatella erecta]SES82022.1 Membrane protein implicated in regulation of membrane protease activity [Stigmatella erecta]